MRGLIGHDQLNEALAQRRVLAVDLRGPVLLVHGERSDIIEAGAVTRMKRVAPHLKVTAVPRVGHAPMLTEPVAREAIAAFLRDAP
jgi:pimeloyl-ACP methyl ester carboxylesterase